MRRKTFDLLAIIGGLVLTVVLTVAGGLLLWGHNFVSDQVHTQLAAQKIYFPPAGSVQGFNWNGRDFIGAKPTPGQPVYGTGPMAGWFYDWSKEAWMEPV